MTRKETYYFQHLEMANKFVSVNIVRIRPRFDGNPRIDRV